MKEWIYKDGSGEYVLTTDPEVANLVVDALEVPEGAEILVYWDGEIKNYFYKENSLIFKNGFWGEVGMGYRMEHILNGWAGKILWQRQPITETEYLLQGKNGDYLLESVWQLKTCNDISKPKHSHYKKDVSHLNVIDPYRIADLYDLHPCAEHIMKKSLCAGGRGHKDLLRDIQDIIDTAERWKEMIEEDNREV